MGRQLARRRRRERTAGVLVVALGIAVLVVALFALHEPNGHVAAAHSKTTSDVAHHTATKPHKRAPAGHVSTSAGAGSHNAVHDVPLVVLNNSGVAGLAAQAAQRFESGGWKVTSFGNYANNIVSTCAYYDPASTQAKDAAEALQAQYPVIKRVEPKFTPDAGSQPLPSGPVVVVLTADYPSG